MSMLPQPSPSRSGPAGNMVGMTQAGNKIPKGYRLGQLQRFSPQQQQLFQDLFSHVGPQSYLQRLARGEEGADEEGAWRDYQTALGGLASRFSGMGMGGKRSSAFQNLGTQSAEDFASTLADRRQGLQREALQELFQLSNLLLSQQPTEHMLAPKPEKRPSFLKQLGLSLIPGVSSAAKFF